VNIETQTHPDSSKNQGPIIKIDKRIGKEEEEHTIFYKQKKKKKKKKKKKILETMSSFEE
jgi:hypothetical protein